jgi:hypothetical protein
MGALRSMDIIKHIKNHGNDDDLYKTYSKDALRTVVSDVRKNVEINKIVAITHCFRASGWVGTFTIDCLVHSSVFSLS